MSNCRIKQPQKKFCRTNCGSIDVGTTERIVNTFRSTYGSVSHPKRRTRSRNAPGLGHPALVQWSPSLVPKPFDWGDLYDIVGTVTLKTEDSSYTASPELEAFWATMEDPFSLDSDRWCLKPTRDDQDDH
ncbi:UDP-glucuronosyl/UDP-glucosyltransferase [Phytophthora cactorum]|nr:UDP-glucuronosyl/UDP-glucosyltransferase [Phytophthora cactorum]